MDVHWGIGTDLGLTELEAQEVARTRFLMSGPGICRLGGGARQTANELWARKATLKLLNEAWGRLNPLPPPATDNELFLEQE